MILTICCAYGEHDSSAVVADDYKILAAVQTERITRTKDDRMAMCSKAVDYYRENGWKIVNK